MKKAQKRNNPPRSKTTAERISDGIDSLLQSEQQTRTETPVFDKGVSKAISTHLHDLLNALWPAAARIEMLISEESCPPKYRETLEELGRCIQEAMTIAANASALVHPASSECPLT